MSNPPPPQARRNHSAVSAICALLFIAFSIAWLYLLQGNALQTIHTQLSGGKTAYSPLWGAVMLTVMMMLVRWGLNVFTRFRRAWLAVSYFPAYLMLILLSGFSPCTDADGHFVLHTYPGLWGCMFVAVLLYSALALFYKRHFSTYATWRFQAMLLPNLLVMIAFTYATGFIGNSNEIYHHELAISQSIKSGHPERVFHIGRKSLHNSHTLTALRAYALSQTDSIGNWLFRFPQAGGAEGLFFNEANGEVSIITNADLYAHLGGTPRRKGETSVAYLRRLCENNHGNHKALDYYLCALLLARQLPAFVQTLDTYYDQDSTLLPRHYQEALILYRLQQGIESRVTEDDEAEAPLLTDTLAVSPAVASRYQAFTALQQEYQLQSHRNNYTRRKFGDTYWWYYWYGE